jgi:PIN domain nuclease of toxin-antitoxin system
VENSFRGLPIVAVMRCVSGISRLSSGPFDRLLVARAQVEDLTLVSRDQQVARYEVEVLW